MPKQVAGINKSKRIEALRKVILKWGGLRKEQVDQLVAANLGVDEKLVSRALYRDLEELVSNHELSLEHYSRDGVLIQNFDPEINKNYYSVWRAKDNSNKILGSGIFENNNISIISSDRISNEISVERGLNGLKNGSVQLFFLINQDFISVTISIDSLPLKILISRSTEEYLKLKDQAETLFGKRLIWILVNDPIVSSFKGELNSGHVLISLENSQKIKVQDLNSKNHTEINKIERKYLDNSLQVLKNLKSQTLTKNSLKQLNAGKPDLVLKNESAELEPEYLITLSESTRFLLFISESKN